MNQKSCIESKLYEIGLSMVPHVGAVRSKQLIAYCGDAATVFRSSARSLSKIPGVGLQIVEALKGKEVLERAKREIEFLQRQGIRPYFFLDDAYPARLKQLADCPLMLYFKGNCDLNSLRTVAIVGTRRPTSYGLSLCEEIVSGLKQYNVLVISGLAFGVDAAAHRVCLREGIPTVGVVGHGLAHLYPHRHKKLATKMLTAGGLVSEFPGDTAPDGRHFPMRNRIIAGLSDAVVVVETGKRGGSMITANLAWGYDRDVFAVPGRTRDPSSEGCNLLIRDQQAGLVTGADDIASFMSWNKDGVRQNIQPRLFVELDEQEKKVVSLLENEEQVSIDRLICHVGVSGSQLSSTLLGLEFKGMIRPLPGKRYVLV